MHQNGVTSLPRRRLLPVGAQPNLDKYGFLSWGQKSLSFDALFDRPVVLIVAPPWMGKSFTARRLAAHFTQRAEVRSEPAAPFGRYFHLTNFEHQQVKAVGSLRPDWWADWRNSSSRACWILDAVDEDERNGNGAAHHVLDDVASLTPAQRSRLHLLIFARENEVPKKLTGRLVEVYGPEPREPSDTGLRTVRLAPLDAEEALEFVGGREAFDRVCRLVLRNALRSIAGYPSALDCLRRYTAEASVTDVDVWRDVLSDLLKDKNVEDPLSSAAIPLPHQFRAAARLAVALTFGDHDEIDDGHGTSGRPSIDRIILSDHADGRALNAAARAALKSSVFRRTAAGYRFAQFHVQEWLAAFGVSGFTLTRLRPLVTDDSGAVGHQYRGVLGLLVRTTRHVDVRDWIVKQYGGVPPRSDAAPWSLLEAVAALDELQRIAATTEWGLSFWDDRGLSFLASPGLGTVLAERLADRTLSLRERELVIDVAQATAAEETAITALRVTQDEKEDSRLRLSAAALALRAGTRAQRMELGEFVKQMDTKSYYGPAIKAAVIYRLYDEGLWDYSSAARHAPPADSQTGMLHHCLEEDMALHNAREVLGSLNIEQALRDIGDTTASRGRGRSYYVGKLLAKAIQLIVEQPDPPEADLDLLIPLAIRVKPFTWHAVDWGNLAPAFAKCLGARRKLFLAVVDAAENANDEPHTLWNWVLVPEDAEWLLGLAETRGQRYPWLWEGLLEFVYRGGIDEAVRQQVLKRLAEIDPKMVEQREERRKRNEQEQREFEREQAERKREREAAMHKLEDLVRDTLSSDEINLKERMLRLSWFCFCERAIRPSNVTGEWEDLSPALRREAIVTCARALRECDPTPVPDGNSYPAGVVYEPWAFVRVLAERGGAYALDSAQIQKWLPAALVFSDGAMEHALPHCAAANAAATEEVVVNEVRRRLRSKSDRFDVVETVPPEIWSPRMAARLAELAQDRAFGVAGRTGLLRVLMTKAADAALPVLKSWLAPAASADEASHAQRQAAVDMLLIADPGIGWPEAERDILAAADRKAAVLRLRSLYRDRHGPVATLTSWTAAMLERLAEILHLTFPAEEDPKRQPDDAYSVTEEDECRRLRGNVTATLWSRGTAEDLAALERVAAKFPSVKEWYDHVRAERAAGDVLRRIGPAESVRRAGHAPIDKVARLLDDAAYRLVRTAEDLQAILVEEIDAIGRNAKEHLSLLYLPRKQQGKQNRRSERTLQEDALQAYFHCRLADRLSERVLDAGARVMFINRETLATKDQRLDLKVQAPAVGGGVATVVIELKWSGNAQVSTSLGAQLGQEYLLGGNLTHGIYLVGWNVPGTWKDNTIDGPDDSTSLDEWLEALRRQARAFSKSHSAVAILPLVIDLVWPPSSGGRERRRRAR